MWNLPAEYGHPVLPERFWTMVDPSSGCWLWRGSLHPSGYAYAFWGKLLRAHRLYYTVFRGPIPAGLTLDHLCRVRHCVNPDHLEPVTRAENVRRAWVFRTSLKLTGETGPLLNYPK